MFAFGSCVQTLQTSLRVTYVECALDASKDASSETDRHLQFPRDA